MHRALRLLGWSIVVAMLLGVLWPERNDSGVAAPVPAAGEPSLASQARGDAPPPGLPSCAPVCDALSLRLPIRLG